MSAQSLEIKAPPEGTSGFTALAPLYEGTERAQKAWLEVVCAAYLFVRLRAEPS